MSKKLKIKNHKPKPQTVEPKPQELITEEPEDKIEVEKFLGYHPVTGAAIFERIE